MKKIAILIPYIGRLRPDFGYWLQSVKNNPTIDFFLLTDASVISPPANLKVISSTFKELRSKFQSRFDFQLCLTHPYKFCDLRPAYGEVFSELLKGYDFWGHTDMDIVYGDLRKYLSEEILEQYDKIYGNGHFSLYRNTPQINEIYKKVEVPTYRQVFSFSEGCAFDEYYGVGAYWAEKLSDRFYRAYPFDDIDYAVPHFEAQMRRKELKGHTNFMYSYEEGKLFRLSLFNDTIVKNEIMYAHFQKRKMNCNVELSDSFMIVPNSYIAPVVKLNVELMCQLTQGVPVSMLKIYIDRLKNKLRKWFFSIILNGEKKPIVTDALKYYKE